MNTYQIVEATLGHTRELVRNLRPEDRLEVDSSGMAARHLVHALWSNSLVRRTALVNGAVAAMWGCDGMIASASANVWLLTTAEVEKLPLAFFRETKRELQSLLETRRQLITQVDAAYKRSIRFFRLIGFTLGPAQPLGTSGRLFHEMTITRAAFERPVVMAPRLAQRRPPFIVYSLGRSRSAWLAAFLTYGEWTCHHERAVSMRSMDDVRAFFETPNMGTIETGVAQGWQLIYHLVPDIRAVVLRRPVEEVVRSMMNVDLGGFASYDEPKLRRTIAYGDRMLEKIGQLPGVLTVWSGDLDRRDVIEAVWSHCLPYPFDADWWGRMKEQNIQVNVLNLMRYYHAHEKELSAFKSMCRAEMRRLAKAGELSHAVH